MKDLDALFYSPKTGFTGFNKFFERVKRQGLNYTRQQVKEYYDNQFTAQVNKPVVNRKKKTYKIVAPFPSFQIDLMFLADKLKGANRGYNQYLVAIEISSRKAFLFPLKTETMSEIIEVFEPFVIEKMPYKIVSDDQFNTKSFRAMLAKQGVELVSVISKDEHITKGSNSLGIVDAFIRTFKQIVQRYIEGTGSKNIYDVYEDLVESYNSSSHSGLNDYTPDEVYVNFDKQKELSEERRKHNEKLREKEEETLPVGQKVRVVLPRGKLEKGTEPRFSRDTYIIDSVTRGGRYRVKEKGGDELRKLYSRQEVQPIGEVQEAPRLKKVKPKEKARQEEAIRADTQRIRMRREGL